MVRSRNLLWVERVYFNGWICSECLWRISVHRASRAVGLHVAKSEFDRHDCSQHPHTSALSALEALHS